MKKRIVITGIGVVAPNGIGKDKYWEALLEGKSGIKNIKSFNVSEYPSKIAGEIDNFVSSDYMDRKMTRVMSRYSQIALAATRMAVKDAELNIDNEDPHKVGISIGTAIGGWEIAEKECYVFFMKNGENISKFAVGSFNPNAGVGIIALELGIKGHNMTISSGCSAGLSAIGYAYDSLTIGKADVIIAGGAEAPLFPFTFESFCASDVLSKRNDKPEEASRPFEKTRDGYVLGEGGAVVVMETLEHALERNARIYAEVAGYGVTNDSFSLFKMEPNGNEAALAMQLAIKNSEISPEDIDYINAHGSSSLVSDRRETMAIKTALGEHAYKTPVSSIKSMIGQSLAASAGIQFATTTLVVHTDHIPPTINYQERDPDCDLDYVPNTQRNGRKIKAALLNSFGAGGNNISMVIKKYN